ncbi:hypothetical protein M2133_001873 [Parabacteroides sp. PF5-6]|nr:hypothetical protein [Parabacteroides sp. PF5-6]
MSTRTVSPPEKKRLPEIDISAEELDAIILKADEGPFYSLEEGWELMLRWREERH